MILRLSQYNYYEYTFFRGENTFLRNESSRIMDMEGSGRRAFEQNCSPVRDFNNVRATLFYFAAIVSRCLLSNIGSPFPFSRRRILPVFSVDTTRKWRDVSYILGWSLLSSSFDDGTSTIDRVRLKIPSTDTGSVGSPWIGGEGFFTILWQTFTLYWFTCRSDGVFMSQQFQARQHCAILRPWFRVTTRVARAIGVFFGAEIKW